MMIGESYESVYQPIKNLPVSGINGSLTQRDPKTSSIPGWEQTPVGIKTAIVIIRLIVMSGWWRRLHDRIKIFFLFSFLIPFFSRFRSDRRSDRGVPYRWTGISFRGWLSTPSFLWDKRISSGATISASEARRRIFWDPHCSGALPAGMLLSVSSPISPEIFRHHRSLHLPKAGSASVLLISSIGSGSAVPRYLCRFCLLFCKLLFSDVLQEKGGCNGRIRMHSASWDITLFYVCCWDDCFLFSCCGCGLRGHGFRPADDHNTVAGAGIDSRNMSFGDNSISISII